MVVAALVEGRPWRLRAPAQLRRVAIAGTGLSLELPELIAARNPVLRGWANHSRHAAAKRTLDYLGYYARWRAGRWLRKKHPRPTWKQIERLKKP